MRTASLLMLAACSATSRPAAPSHVSRSPDPVVGPAQSTRVTIEHDEDVKPAARPETSYALPAALASALAREKLRGTVLVAGPLFPSEAAARNVVTSMGDQAPIALRVLADHGDVVKVATGAVSDCVEGFGPHYNLTVYVPRTALVPRTTKEVMKTFDDGTAYVIDRGAPVKLTATGLGWYDDLLERTHTEPPERLTYSLAKPYVQTAIPAPPGERLICDGAPMSKGEWMAHQQQRAADQQRAAERRVATARAEVRTEAAGTESAKLVDLVLARGAAQPAAKPGDDKRPTYCSAAIDGVAQALASGPTLDGAPFTWTSPHPNDHVYRAERGYLADVGGTCGRVRVAVDPRTLRGAPREPALTVAGTKQQVWMPRPGPVFWADGRKAGKFTGRTVRYTRVHERGALICVDVRGVAEEVCHRAADVTVE